MVANFVERRTVVDYGLLRPRVVQRAPASEGEDPADPTRLISETALRKRRSWNQRRIDTLLGAADTVRPFEGEANYYDLRRVEAAEVKFLPPGAAPDPDDQAKPGQPPRGRRPRGRRC